MQMQNGNGSARAPEKIFNSPLDNGLREAHCVFTGNSAGGATKMQITVPDVFTVTLRGVERSINSADVSESRLTQSLAYGVQRILNDRMKTENSDPEPERVAEADGLIAKFYSGEPFSTRKGGTRTTDKVAQMRKAIANEEINATDTLNSLLKFHNGISRKEFDSDWRAKYVAMRLDPNGKHFERIDREAKRRLSAAQKQAPAGELSAGESGLLDF